MGLFAFNRMRLRKVEEMKPENIEKESAQAKQEVEETKNAVEEVKENIEKDFAEAEKEEVKRGSSRKK